MRCAYLVIYEDNEIKQTSAEPCQGDLESIAAGILTYIRFHDGHFQNLTEQGVWETLI